MKAVNAAIWFTMATASTAASGPDEITQRLMDENVSLLDWGVYRLESALRANEGTERTYVNYDWDSNRVLITEFRLVDGELELGGNVQEICDDWFRTVRLFAFVNPDTGATFMDGASDFTNFFKHEGYTTSMGVGENRLSTSEVAAEMDAKFFLNFFLRPGLDTNGAIEAVECTGPLVETGFSVKTTLRD